MQNKFLLSILFFLISLSQYSCVSQNNSKRIIVASAGKIGDIFGTYDVSIESIVQLDTSADKAEIVVITHEVNTGNFEKSKDEINSLDEVQNIASQLSCI